MLVWFDMVGKRCRRQMFAERMDFVQNDQFKYEKFQFSKTLCLGEANSRFSHLIVCGESFGNKVENEWWHWPKF